MGNELALCSASYENLELFSHFFFSLEIKRVSLMNH